MALPKLPVSKPNIYYSPQDPPFETAVSRSLTLSNIISRREQLTLSAALMSQGLLFRHEESSSAHALDRTVQEAEVGIKEHAEDLLGVKNLIEKKLWREAQRELRKSSSNLKQDIYSIIQEKPGNERPKMRKLYSDLFNNVSRLDYAARDEDAARVWECYGNIVAVLDEILSRI